VKPCIQIGDGDNVANVLTEVLRGETLTLSGPVSGFVDAVEDIRCFHKIAMRDIDRGCDIVRGGYVIGKSKSVIKRGEWVHVHNMESKRA
jgi:hypothetical protein